MNSNRRSSERRSVGSEREPTEQGEIGSFLPGPPGEESNQFNLVTRYPKRLMEIYVIAVLQMVPLYLVHPAGGRQPMQHAEMATRTLQLGETGGLLASQMGYGRERIDATNAVDEIRWPVQETSQSSSFMQQLTLNCSTPTVPVLSEGQVYGGKYVWTVECFSQLIQDADADNGIKTSIESPPIHTSLHGYKFFARIFPKGISGGDGRHIGLFVGIMQGKYDTILKWPFCGIISLTVKDQSGDRHVHDISGTFVANGEHGAFQKPAAAGQWNTMYGYAEFAPLAMVCDPRYCQDDTVMIEIDIRQNL